MRSIDGVELEEIRADFAGHVLCWYTGAHTVESHTQEGRETARRETACLDRSLSCCWCAGVAKGAGESLGTVCAPDYEQQTVLSFEELYGIDEPSPKL